MSLSHRTRRRTLAFAVALVAFAVPSPALGACGTDVLNELLANGGAIPEYHTQACYNQALDLLGEDAKVYTNYESVIRASMRRDRVVDRRVTAPGDPTTDEPRTTAAPSGSAPEPAPATTSVSTTSAAEPEPGTTSTDTSSGPSATLGEPPGSDGVVSGALEAAGPERVDQVPMPVIVLGALAAMLIAAGAVSTYLRRRTSRLQ